MNKVIKSFSVETKAIDLEAGVFEAMISTEAVDRSGDIVRAAGAKIENYLKNPVVMWAHDYSLPPVAKALSIEVIPGQGIKSSFQFAPWGANAQADTVRKLWAGGFLNAVSIGFIPLASEDMKSEDPGMWFTPKDYTEWELLEYSIVPIPANQEALRMAIKSLAAHTQVTPPEGGDNQNSNAEAHIDLTSNDATEEEEIIKAILSAPWSEKWTKN